MNAHNELKGYLGGFDLTDVLQLISQQQKTGILTVKSSVGQVALSFKNGQIIGMNPDMEHQEFDLEHMLRKSDYISISRLNNLRQEQVRRNISLEQMLEEHEVMTAEEIGKLNLLRIFESLVCILKWKKGSYTFQPTIIVHETPYLPPQPADFVLFEVLRQMDELSVFEQNIPSANCVYETVSTFASETDDDLFSNDFKDRLQADEQTILELVTKNYMVQDIIDKSLLGKYTIYRILNSFLESGIIAQKGEKAATSSGISGSGYLNKCATAVLFLSLVTYIVLALVAFIPSAWLPIGVPGHHSRISPSRKILSSYLKQKNKPTTTPKHY